MGNDCGLLVFLVVVFDDNVWMTDKAMFQGLDGPGVGVTQITYKSNPAPSCGAALTSAPSPL
jgi:hypothetical protein